jgi:DTW domain-containing protein YfiP
MSETTRAPRPTCLRCRRALSACYCASLSPFTPAIRFVILIHPDETKRSIATGRMTHLTLENSLLLEGMDFTHHPIVNGLLRDQSNAGVVLFPAKQAITLTPETPAHTLFPADKQAVVFLLDGTWQHARKIRRLSKNLHPLPTIALAPIAPSAFRVRKQPRAGCLSTLEAAHAILDWHHTQTTPHAPRHHDHLLPPFHAMVRTQERWQSPFSEIPNDFDLDPSPVLPHDHPLKQPS